MSAATEAVPRVWLACLHCYNDGRLVGQWVDCTDADSATLEGLHETTGGPDARCEEIWCLDVDALPVDREMDLLEAAEWGRVYSEVGSDQWPALSAWVRSGSYVAEGRGERVGQVLEVGIVRCDPRRSDRHDDQDAEEDQACCADL